VGLVGFLTAVNYRGVRHSAWVQNLFTFGLLAVFVIFSSLGLLRGRVENLAPPFAHPDKALPAALSVFLVLQIAPYFIAGFETVARCAEERHADFAEHRFVAITVTALSAGIFFYASVIVVVALLHPWQELAGVSSATLVAFRRAFGSEFLVNLILFGAILSLIKVFNGCMLAASRLLFAMGRAGMVPAVLGDVHERYHTPRTAIVLVGVLAAGGCFLGKAVLVPISEVGSFAYAVGWLAACLAFFRGVGQGSALERWGLGLTGAGVCVLLLGMKLVPWVPGSFNPWEYTALGGWVVLGGVLWWQRPRSLVGGLRGLSE
jgi:amino acid transporter